MARLESNTKLVKFLRGAVEDFEDTLRRELLPATGVELEELKSNLYDFYLGDHATEMAGGNENGARKLFCKYVDEWLDDERAAAATPSGAATRYELKAGTSSKFWQIALDGKSFTTTWGRIGTAGQSQVKKWKDAATARKEQQKLVAEKTKKGYQPVVVAVKPAKKPTAKARARR